MNAVMSCFLLLAALACAGAASTLPHDARERTSIGWHKSLSSAFGLCSYYQAIATSPFTLWIF